MESTEITLSDIDGCANCGQTIYEHDTGTGRRVWSDTNPYSGPHVCPEILYTVGIWHESLDKEYVYEFWARNPTEAEKKAIKKYGGRTTFCFRHRKVT